MKCSRRHVRSWFLLVTSTVLVLSLSACKTKPKATNVGVLGSRDLVPPPYAKPVAADPSRSSSRPIVSPEMSAASMQSDSEPILPTAESFIPAETPVYVPAENLPEPEKILTTPPAAAKVTPTPSSAITTPVPAAPAVPTENLRKYQVQKGDTMSGIAQCIGVRWQDIAALNPNVNPNRMMVGQTLVLPSHAQDKPIVMPKSSKAASRKTASSGSAVKTSSIPSDGVYTVAAGDSLWIISRRFKVSSDDIRTWNDLKTDKLTIGQKLKLKSTATVKETTPKAAVKPTTTAAKVEPKAVEKAPPVTPEAPVEATLITPAEAVPADAAANTRAIDHLISENDTLESIAMLYEVKLEDLLRSNPNIKSNADLVPNTTIKIAYPAKK